MMSDQAQLLRKMVDRKEESIKPGMHIITVASGKGGVGKSNLSVNLALALKALGKKPIILDADFGLANIEIILGERPKYNLSHLIKGECQIEDLIAKSKYGISFISGGSGTCEMNFLPVNQISYISSRLALLSHYADVLIIDTGAGISDTVVKFCSMADEIYMVITPEPTAIANSYALIKVLVNQFSLKTRVKIVINKVESQKEAWTVFDKLSNVCKNFLDYGVDYSCFIVHDAKFLKAAKKQIPILIYAPYSYASVAYSQMAKQCLRQLDKTLGAEENREHWVNRFKRLFG